jgi:hypothetical protein
MTDFRSFTLEDAVAVASAALTQASGRPVSIDATRSLGQETGRNLVLRGHAVQGDTEPRAVIIKATRARGVFLGCRGNDVTVKNVAVLGHQVQ